MDIFAVDVNGSIVTSAWQPGFPQWTEWRPIPGITTIPGANVFPILRSIDKLDIFVADGVDGQIFTAAWEPSFGSEWGSWRSLTQLSNSYPIYATPGDLIGAVSRSTDKLDIFVGGLQFYLDGVDQFEQPVGVQTTAWEPGFPDWTPWRSMAGGGTAYFASPVTAVSRSTDLIDIFATDQDTTVQDRGMGTGRPGLARLVARLITGTQPGQILRLCLPSAQRPVRPQPCPPKRAGGGHFFYS
jgi:hypothetical protein